MFLLLIPDDGPKWPKHVCLKTYLKKKKLQRSVLMFVSDHDSPCVPKLQKHTCNFCGNSARVKSQIEKAGGNSVCFTPTPMK